MNKTHTRHEKWQAGYHVSGGVWCNERSSLAIIFQEPYDETVSLQLLLPVIKRLSFPAFAFIFKDDSSFHKLPLSIVSAWQLLYHVLFLFYPMTMSFPETSSYSLKIFSLNKIGIFRCSNDRFLVTENSLLFAGKKEKKRKTRIKRNIEAT